MKYRVFKVLLMAAIFVMFGTVNVFASDNIGEEQVEPAANWEFHEEIDFDETFTVNNVNINGSNSTITLNVNYDLAYNYVDGSYAYFTDAAILIMDIKVNGVTDVTAIAYAGKAINDSTAYVLWYLPGADYSATVNGVIKTHRTYLEIGVSCDEYGQLFTYVYRYVETI